MKGFLIFLFSICTLIVAPLNAQNTQKSDEQLCLDLSGDEAIAACTRAIDSHTLPQKNQANAYYNRGYEYWNKDEYDLAIANYSEAIRLDPTLVEAYNNRALCLFDKGEYDRALPDYEKALQLDPKHTNAYYGLGNLYRAKAEYSKAIENYTKTLELNPNFSNAYINRGNTYTAMGAFDMAIADYKDAIRTKPTYAYTPLLIAVAKMHKGDNAIADELGDEAKALSSSWPMPVLQFYMGKLTADELIAAAKDPDAKTQQVNFCEMYYFLGEWQLFNGQRLKGIDSLKQANANCTQKYFEYDSVKAELKRLGQR
ncbi:MAG TPA: tetratricopeptide repeat protein [Terracidiphilus sp.]|jgi:lipoprotein NlpI